MYFLWIFLFLAQGGHAIHGGKYAEPGEFPHLVQIYYSKYFTCGGSIMAPDLVLTAAHCVKNLDASEMFVIAGTNQLKQSFNYTEKFQQISRIKDFYTHPLTNFSGYLQYDVAIILLDKPFHFSDKVKSIALPGKDETIWDYANQAMLSGWGLTEEIGEASTLLKKLNVTLANSERCKDFFFRNGVSDWPFQNNQICVRTDFGSGVCKGDSGGSLVCQRTNPVTNISTFVLCGVASWADVGLGCGNSNFQVFMDVAKLLDWTEKTISQIHSRTRCKPDHFYCASNHTCIPRALLCDTFSDCEGDEDETNCDRYTPCQKDQFRCNNGKCIGIEERCDGTNDCEDMPGSNSSSDEEKCPKLEKEKCGKGTHDCGDGDRCIMKKWVCDGIVDCENRSDEPCYKEDPPVQRDDWRSSILNGVDPTEALIDVTLPNEE